MSSNCTRTYVASLVRISAIGAIAGVLSTSGYGQQRVAAVPLNQQSAVVPNLTTSYSVIASSPQGRSTDSEIVAEVVVASITSAQFNTSGGTVPPGGYGDPEQDEEEWNLHRSATLNVVHAYACPPGTDMIVMPMMGGVVQNGLATGVPFMHAVDNVDYNNLQPGNTAMLFGSWQMHQRPSSPDPWVGRLFDIVDNLDLLGHTAIEVSPSALYIYDYSANTATSPEVDETTLPISQLRTIADNP